LLVTANFVPSSPILVTQMMEIPSSETSFLQKPRGVTSQKTSLFIVTAVKTLNHTQLELSTYPIKPLHAHCSNSTYWHPIIPIRSELYKPVLQASTENMLLSNTICTILLHAHGKIEKCNQILHQSCSNEAKGVIGHLST
jgi:hypothetical protein